MLVSSSEEEPWVINAPGAVANEVWQSIEFNYEAIDTVDGLQACIVGSPPSWASGMALQAIRYVISSLRQPKIMKQVAGQLKLQLAQFSELQASWTKLHNVNWLVALIVDR